MALTNIELYEALKKDVSEDSARMIAEVVPKASDLATKADVAELRHATQADITDVRQDLAELRQEVRDGFASVRQEMAEFRAEMLDRIAAVDRRTLRYAMAFVAPLWAAFIAALVKIVLEL